jgi:hypothetical protein
MASGEFEGKTINDPEIRKMFTRDYLISSDWYQERLKTKQTKDIELWKKHIQYLEKYIKQVSHAETMVELNLHDRLEDAKKELERVSSSEYIDSLQGTLGADPLRGQTLLETSSSASEQKD